MMSDNERERGVEPAGEVSEADEAARPRPRTRVVSEAVAAGLSDARRHPRPRVFAEAVVAAIPEPGPAEGADAEAGAGA